MATRCSGVELTERFIRMAALFGAYGLVARLKADLEPLRAAVKAVLGKGDWLSLNNLGTNGNLLKTPECTAAYEVVERLAWDLVPNVGLRTTPVIRVKGRLDKSTFGTSYIHSDTFAGHPTGCVVMIPICGDFEAGGVSFYRPTKGVFKDYPNYADLDFGPEYIGKMDGEHIHVLDAYCLHKTDLGGLRVSVDFRMILPPIEGDFLGTEKALKLYA